MLIVPGKPFMLSVVLLNVVILSVILLNVVASHLFQIEMLDSQLYVSSSTTYLTEEESNTA